MIHILGDNFTKFMLIGKFELNPEEKIFCDQCEIELGEGEKYNFGYLYKSESGIIAILCEKDHQELQNPGSTIKKGTFIIVNWFELNGSDAVVVSDKDGSAKLFSTREEAEEYWATKMNGYMAIMEVAI